MLPKFAKLQKIENRHNIRECTDSAFWKHLQNSLLLGLKEQGRLTDLQYRYAMEYLRLLPEDPPENNA